MPLFVGPLVALALGAALAWVGRAEARREDEEAIRARLLVAAIYGALVVAPACAYFLIFHGDWALFYVTDARQVPSAIELAVVMVDALLVPVGLALGHRAARARAERALIALAVGPIAIAAALLLVFQAQLRVEGTYHQVTARFGTQPIAGSALGWAVLWMGAMISAGFVIAARALAEKPRLARRLPAPDAEGPRPLLGRGRSEPRFRN